MDWKRSEIRDDAVDLLLRNNLEGAIRRYLDMYLDSLVDGDRYIGPDLCAQLLYAVAATNEHPAEEVIGEVKDMLQREIDCRGVVVDSQIVEDDLEAARTAVASAKKRAERSVERVEAETESRWSE